ncbi:6878_t:CDS:1, partial [Paraglomus occultum]
LEIYCELVRSIALPGNNSQEIILGIINKQIVAGTFTYQVVTDITGPNSVPLPYGSFIL